MNEGLIWRGALRWLAVFSSLLCLVCATASAASAKAVPQGFVGMTVDGPLWPNTDSRVNLPQQLNRMVASGVQNLRMPLYWSYLQPYASFQQIPAFDKRHFVSVGGVPTTWDSLDTLVSLAAARHLTLLPIVIDAPNWDAVRTRGVVLKTPRHNAPFARFLAAAVKRYGPHGSFWARNRALPKVPIRNWQIWNEPYYAAEWQLTPHTWWRSYMSLVHSAHDAIKHADPGAKIVLAGLASFSYTWLTDIYKVRGARKWFDVVALHPYTAAPAGVITLLQLARQAMAKAGDSRKPIAITELGWPSSCQHMIGTPTHQHCSRWLTRSPFGWEADQAGQRSRLTAVLRLLAADRARYHVIGFDYYDWAGVEFQGAPSFNFAGLFRLTSSGLLAKPAFSAFKKGVLALERCRAKGPTATSCLH